MLFASLLILVAASSGCISQSSSNGGPTTYVNVCSVVGENILIKVVGNELNPEAIKEPLANAFVDDLTSEQAQKSYDTYTLDCWWGWKVGESKNLYYCEGSYIAPELDKDNVIKNYLKKEFKIGFNVIEKPGSSWTVGGKTHIEPKSYLLTVKSVEVSCSTSSGPEEAKKK